MAARREDGSGELGELVSQMKCRCGTVTLSNMPGRLPTKWPPGGKTAAVSSMLRLADKYDRYSEGILLKEAYRLCYWDCLCFQKELWTSVVSSFSRTPGQQGGGEKLIGGLDANHVVIETASRCWRSRQNPEDHVTRLSEGSMADIHVEAQNKSQQQQQKQQKQKQPSQPLPRPTGSTDPAEPVPAAPQRASMEEEDHQLRFPSLPASKEDILDWAYPMRRDMQEILPGLFLGPYSAAMKSKLPSLESQGITHVVCVRQDIEANFIKPNFEHTFRYLVLDIADNPVENIIRFFPMTKEFIDSSIDTGGKVLVHGNAGISRSAALVIAYLMETFGMKYRDAFSHVQERRFCINPNVGFVHQLQEYEAIYLAKLTIKMMSPMQLGRSFSVQAGVPGGRKRSLEEDEDLGGMQVTAAQNG
ncbi:Serine/threonine/tyrosine-interacting protein [Merluccius polli]|uniref:Serine/threonine/tyrosine-interacting protein n=1 Tax=Merluccius polli TaxID=89951 RepID=A0AA47P6G6_MERPO|nr:Serine/threonine/tyrosine-interacting protein [Merluccius polli]